MSRAPRGGGRGPGRRRVLAIIALAAVAGCQKARAPVKVAVAFTGRNIAAAYLAADEINSAGGLRGRVLQLVRDTIPVQAEPADVEIQRAQSLVAAGPLVAVIGHGGSRGSLAAAPVYNDAQIVQIVPNGTSRLLAHAGAWTLPLPPNDSIEGAFIAHFVKDSLRAASVVVFYVSDEYGVGLRDGILAALAGSGIRVLREQRYDVASNLEPLVDVAVRGGVPDVVIVAGRTVAACAIARRLAIMAPRARIVAGDGAVNMPDLARDAGPWAEGRLYAATFWLGSASDSASRRFARALFGRVQREATAADALVYDAVKVLAAAVREVGDDPAAVRAYLLTLGRSRPRYQGVTGEIGFGDVAGPPRLVMGVVRGNSLVPVDSTAP
jgi:ABC-type branched-subunit amino acid transport system substrate-binding protein